MAHGALTIVATDRADRLSEMACSTDELLDDGADFATVLRWCRRRAGLGQSTLAELAGLGVRTIRDLELGRTAHPHRESIRLLADALGLAGGARERFGRVAAGQSATPEPLPLPTLPSQLPADIADFTGRAEHMATLRSLLTGADPAPAAVVLCGQPGAGKTALAVHAGHAVGSSFPDGHLFANLRGTEAEPRAASDVLAGFLRALGVADGDIPADLDGRATLYRSRTAARGVLVLLDDAVSESQVRPLLPGGARCATLVTSRARLAGLEAAAALPVGVLEPPEAVLLLGRVAGEARTAAEAGAAAEITERCGRLPLAVRIAGARLASRPHWTLSRLAARLADEHRRLDELRVGDLDVRARFSASYRLLGAEARTAFRRTALLDTPDVAAWAVAALVDGDVERSEHLYERLVDLHLVEEAGEDAAGQLRYRMHDLLRAFAHERLLQEESPDSCEEALCRVVDRGLALANRAAVLLGLPEQQDAATPADDGSPTFSSWWSALTWLASERDCLGAVFQAGDADAARSWQLADLLAKLGVEPETACVSAAGFAGGGARPVTQSAR